MLYQRSLILASGEARAGDRINAVLAGAAYDYRLVLKWLRVLFARMMAAILKRHALSPTHRNRTPRLIPVFFTDDYMEAGLKGLLHGKARPLAEEAYL